MAITKIASARNATSTIKYVKGSRFNPRSLAEGGQYIHAPIASREFKRHIDSHGKQDNVHTYNVKVSFDKSDLDPDNEDDILKCAEFADDYMQEAFPDRLVFYGIHNDGVGGKMHIHFIVSNVDLNGKCARGNEMSWTRLAPITDKICKQHGLSVLDKDKDNLRYIEDYKKRKRNKEKEADYRSPLEETMHRQGRANQSYKEVLRQQIASVIEGSDEIEPVETLDAFKQVMKDEFDVDVVQGKRDLEYKFKWKDKDKSITARKLGNDYKATEIEQRIEERSKIADVEELDVTLDSDDSDFILKSHEMATIVKQVTNNELTVTYDTKTMIDLRLTRLSENGKYEYVELKDVMPYVYDVNVTNEGVRVEEKADVDAEAIYTVLGDIKRHNEGMDPMRSKEEAVEEGQAILDTVAREHVLELQKEKENDIAY